MNLAFIQADVFTLSYRSWTELRQDTGCLPLWYVLSFSFHFLRPSRYFFAVYYTLCSQYGVYTAKWTELFFSPFLFCSEMP